MHKKKKEKYITLNGKRCKVSELKSEVIEKLNLKVDNESEEAEKNIMISKVSDSDIEEKIVREKAPDRRKSHTKKEDSGMDIVARMIGRELGHFARWLNKKSK